MKLPGQLYKFQSFSLQALEALASETVWFAHPKSLNDPFEFNYERRQILDTSVSKEEYVRIRRQIKNAVYDYFPIRSVPDTDDYDHQQLFEELMDDVIPLYWKDFGIYSTSAVNNHQLLWAHYADGHKGFAIEFDTSKAIDLTGLDAFEITYSDNLSKVPIQEFIDNPTQVIQKLSTQKSRDWEYEKEWRLMSHENNVARKFPWKVRSLIFGYRMSEIRRNILRRLCDPGVIVQEVQPLPGNYYMEVKEITINNA